MNLSLDSSVEYFFLFGLDINPNVKPITKPETANYGLVWLSREREKLFRQRFNEYRGSTLTHSCYTNIQNNMKLSLPYGQDTDMQCDLRFGAFTIGEFENGGVGATKHLRHRSRVAVVEVYRRFLQIVFFCVY